MTQRLARAAAILLVSLLAAGCQSEGSRPSATHAATGHRATTFDWSISKSALPDVLNLILGQSDTSQFTINVIKSMGSEKFSVDGQVCVTNDGNKPTDELVIAVDVLFQDPANPAAPVQVLTTPLIDVSARPSL